jgi:hypothetical protein
MNVFVLGTGRCGSTTFAMACAHATNFSSAHESRSGLVGEARLAYPANHVEVDNRLSWMLGRLHAAFGDEAMYVHLQRNEIETARSFVRRYDRSRGIVYAYRTAILMKTLPDVDPLAVCTDYCRTVNANIAEFLRGKPQTLTVSLENAKADFRKFWNFVGAAGDLDAALAVWDRQYNATSVCAESLAQTGPLASAARKLRRIVRTLPAYLRDA